MILLGVGAFSQACTKLDEELYSEVTPANFFKTDAEFVAALGSAYTQLGGYAMGDLRHVNTVTTDEGVYNTGESYIIEGAKAEQTMYWTNGNSDAWVTAAALTGPLLSFSLTVAMGSAKKQLEVEALVDTGSEFELIMPPDCIIALNFR